MAGQAQHEGAVMDANWSRFWLDAAQWVVSGLLALFIWWRTRDKNRSNEIAAVRTLLDGVDEKHDRNFTLTQERASRIESDLRQTLRAEHLEDLYDRLNTQNREMGELSQELKATRNLLHTVHQFLLNLGAKRDG